MSRIPGIVLLAALIAVAGCSKAIKPSDKPLYDKAVAAIDEAKAEIKESEKSPTIKDLNDLFNIAKGQLSTAEDFLNKDNYTKAALLAQQAKETARNVRELPLQVQNLVSEVESSLQFARELGMDKTYGKKIKEISDDIWEVKNNVRLKRYEIAKTLATQAQGKIKKALDEVEKATIEVTKAKTALAEAKDANADTLAADIYKSAEEALETAKKAMDSANFKQAEESANKAGQLAQDALVQAKKEAVKQQNTPAPVPETK